MARTGYVGITIPKDAYDSLKNSGLLKGDEKSFSGWITDLFVSLSNKQKFLDDFSPRLSFVGGSNESLIIKDQTAKESRLSEITIRNNKLHCSLDDNDCCAHIHYALVLPELGKIIKTKNGGK